MTYGFTYHTYVPYLPYLPTHLLYLAYLPYLNKWDIGYLSSTSGPLMRGS